MYLVFMNCSITEMRWPRDAIRDERDITKKFSPSNAVFVASEKVPNKKGFAYTGRLFRDVYSF